MAKLKTMLEDIRAVMYDAVRDPANVYVGGNDDGQINWNFVEADIWLALQFKYDVNSELFRESVELIFEEEF